MKLSVALMKKVDVGECRKAGIDPLNGINMFERLEFGGESTTQLPTHSSSPTDQRYLNKIMGKLQKYPVKMGNLQIYRQSFRNCKNVHHRCQQFHLVVRHSSTCFVVILLIFIIPSRLTVAMDPTLPSLAIGATFNSRFDLKSACKEYAITEFFEFETVKSDNQRYTIKCKIPECNWHLSAWSVESTSRFRIKMISESHDCFGLGHTSHVQASESFIALKIRDKLIQQLSYRPRDIILDVKRELGIDITYFKAYRAKQLALEFINGNHEESYAKLPQYCEDIVRANPGSTAFIDVAEDNKFRCMFVCFGAAAQGFAHCLPILGLDGTHLKSKYLGILLAATAVDALGSLFPLAHAVVDAENDENWLWFLTTLRQNVIELNAPGFLEDGRLVLLSDRQKGLLDGVEAIFPLNPHGYCIRHLQENFHKIFKNTELTGLLWKAARAMDKEEYDSALADIKSINPESVSWLLEHADPRHWAELYFEGQRYGHLTSNIAESLNSWLLEAREMPVLSMFERIRHQLMDWYTIRRTLEIDTLGILVSPISEKIQHLIRDRACRYRFHSSNDVAFEVISNVTKEDYLVNLQEATCSCYAWQKTGYPCGHALSIIMSRREDPQAYAKHFWTLKAYKSTYDNAIVHPLTGTYCLPLQTNDNVENIGPPDEPDMNDDVLLPPSTRRPAGRPKKRRIRSVVENDENAPRRINRCSRCKAIGHSKRTCREAI